MQLPFLPSIGRLLNATARSAINLAETWLTPHDLSLPQWVILSALWQCDGMNASEIGEYGGIKKAALSRMLERMEERQLIRRERGTTDKREVTVWLTCKSRELSHLIDMYEHVNNILLEGFRPEERDILISMLERVRSNTLKSTPNNGSCTDSPTSREC